MTFKNSHSVFGGAAMMRMTGSGAGFHLSLNTSWFEILASRCRHFPNGSAQFCSFPVMCCA